jgi:6-phosphogluconolactonase
VEGFDLEVLPTAALAAEAAARRFVSVASDAIRSRGEFVVALSGGSTPGSMYARLAAEPLASSLDWSRVQVLWGDERCVPPDHEASNYRMACEALLDRVPVPEANVHRIRGEDDPAEAATGYERVMRGVLRTPTGPPRDTPGARIDLVLLGLGEDGHTASLFPGGAVAHDSPVWVRAAYVPAVSAWRVTLTPVIINAAAEVLILVSGGAKAAILRKVLEGPRRPHELPAQLIAPAAGRLLWFLDAPAAAELRGGAGR